MIVAVLHTAFAIVMFGRTYLYIIQRGFFNAVYSEQAAAAVWFIFFGFLLFICSLLCAEIEKNESFQFPKSVGIALLLTALLGVILMPASGFWLIFPPTIALLIKKEKTN